MLLPRRGPRRDVIISMLQGGHALRPRFAAPDADLWSLAARAGLPGSPPMASYGEARVADCAAVLRTMVTHRPALVTSRCTRAAFIFFVHWFIFSSSC